MTEVVAAPTAGETGEVTRISHWIGGKLVPGTSGRSGPVYNPATGRQTGAVDFASVEDVDLAVQTAKQTFESWRLVSISKRVDIMFRIRELIHDRREDIARYLTAEHGKVLSDALGEVARGLEVVEFACGIPTLVKGDFSEQVSTGVDVHSVRQPLGVAKNHMVVLPDADVDMAADAAVSAAYGSAGERCMAVSVVVAVGDVADPLVQAIRDRAPRVKVGGGLEPGSEMGPLITREHRDKVATYIDK